MPETVRDLKDWLDKFNDRDTVGVDEGGLCLVVRTAEVDYYYEIGGMPDEIDEKR